MMTMHISRVFKAALAAGALLTLSNCANDANSDFAYGSLEASDSRSSVVDLGYAAAARGDHATAIQYFRSAHAKNLAYAFARHEPLIGLGQSLLAIGQNGDAAKVFIKAAKAGGGAEALRGLAQAQLYINQPGLAVESARRAVQLDPNDAKAMGILGIALDVLGDHQSAASIYSDAMSRFPGSLSLASNHGLSMVMTGDIEAGIRLLEDVVRDPRATARDRQNLALAYALDGDYDRGAALAAIDLDVTGVKANLLYADMLRAMSPKARLSALVVGAQNPKTDKSQNANAVYIKGDNAAWVEASVRRLVPVEGSADLAGVPPLMDPTGWAVQIAAYRKLEHLAPGWAYLSSKYAAIIGGLEPRRSEVNHPAAAKGPVGFFYRLNAGPLRSRAEARDICARLTARGAECWVRPPTAGEGRLPDGDRMAKNAKSNAAESAIVASSDYNAVVNQFARAMVMKSRKSAPATVRDLPDVMTAQNAAPMAPADAAAKEDKAAPAEMAAAVPAPQKAPTTLAAKEDETQPSRVPAADTAQKTQDVASKPAATLQVSAEADPQDPPKPKPAAVSVPAAAEPVAETIAAPIAAPSAKPNIEPAQKPVQRKAKPQDIAPARLQTVSEMAPSADPAQPPVSPDTLEALSHVFDAVEEAENQKTDAASSLPPAPKLLEDAAYDEMPASSPAISPETPNVPSPGKIIPAMTRFNDGANSAARQIKHSGNPKAVLQQSGTPLEAYSTVDNGVY